MPDLASGPLLYLVTGPPGAGKTTALSELERRHARLVRFGVRDYGLQLAAAGDPLGLTLRDALLRNELLPDELVRREFVDFLARVPPGAGTVIVEGYPRDLVQCSDLMAAADSHGARIAAFIVVEVPDNIARDRVARRRICSRCGRTVGRADAVECADCGGPLKARNDDAGPSFTRRLVDYRAFSARLRPYFAARGMLRIVDGRQSRTEVCRSLANLIDGAGREDRR